MHEDVVLASVPLRISFFLLHTPILGLLGPLCEMLHIYQKSLKGLSLKVALGKENTRKMLHLCKFV